MGMNNPIVLCVVLSIVFVAIFIVLFTISQTMKRGSRRHGSIQTIKKQPRCLKIFRTRF